MTVKAAVLLDLPGSISLDGRDDLIEKLRETAHPMPDGNRHILVEWEAPDLWQLRGQVEETVKVIESEYKFNWGVKFTDREPAGDGTDSSNLAQFNWWAVE